jgi:hypothetical protein
MEGLGGADVDALAALIAEGRSGGALLAVDADPGFLCADLLVY